MSHLLSCLSNVSIPSLTNLYTDVLFLFQGDEGGPLVDDLGAATFKLIGVSSFFSTFGCVAGATAGFTRVSRYLDWISETASIIIKD